MSFEMIFFILVGALSVGTAVGVVTSRIAVHSALFLLVHFATLAILYVTLNAQFLAAAQIIVYAGGIVILILFVIMLIGSAPLETRAGYRSWVPYAGLALGVVMLAGMALTVLQMPPATINPAANEGGVPIVLGVEIYSQNILLVELAAVLLLVALLGALLLARRPKTEETSIS
ncbi:MAG: NADH-quinone oxidoreductase subunit J [Caldilinea sp.]|nr:NADH-quinone oxidoreductase subunit J [Caldilinea sp.]MCB0067733.1 NADH-quinone oxidoreductase subunit J [Caldilineaceae bacterium]MCB0039449.1 NADH-quinone oxidoreductase subunit J [Caldilinea sp.]MCB9114139.1 NADH-quinone oxidoreductase subunit J [Caldilineaceae bacterium]MCB9125243.1 NADH-quinone oxidoreductase subunit J [Caldilineaceae bacterium]